MILVRWYFNYTFLLTADIISTVEFNHSGELLATGDKGGRVVIFQQEPEVSVIWLNWRCTNSAIIGFCFVLFFITFI